MARAKTEIFSTSLQSKLTAASYALGESNDCTVRALAVTTGVAYEVAHAALAAAGRKNGKGTHFQVQLAALRALGFTMVAVDSRALINQYPGVHKGLRNVTTHHPERFPTAFAGMGPALLYTPGHVAGMTEGVVHDWTRGKAVRVRGIYRVVPA